MGAAALLFGCGDDAEGGVGTGGQTSGQESVGASTAGPASMTATSTSASETSTSQPTAASSSSSSDEGSGAIEPSLEGCMDATAIELDCGEDSRFQYVSFGDTLGCGGFSSFTQDEVVRFAFSLDDVVDGVIQVQSLRISTSETLLEAFADVAVPLPEFPQTLDASNANLMSDPPGLFEVLGAEGTIALDTVPTMEDLDATAIVSGTFEFRGGAVTSIGQAVDDPGLQVHGCFYAPAESHPVELD